jgi:hypothetical protein
MHVAPISNLKSQNSPSPAATRRDAASTPSALPLPVVFEDGRPALAVKINPLTGFALLVFLRDAFKKVHRAHGADAVEKVPAARAQYRLASLDDLFPGSRETSLDISGRLHITEHVIRAALNCCDATIHNWRKLRGFPLPHRVHRDNYYPAVTIIQWIARQSMLL